VWAKGGLFVSGISSVWAGKEDRLMSAVFWSIEEIAEIISRKSGGKTVVLANGCFDILHVGHVRYLTEASKLGDILVVAVNGDDSTRDLKGPGRPLMPAEERAEIISQLKPVDYVIIFEAESVDGILRNLKPDIHAKGTDYTVDSVPERETAGEVGCRTVITGDPKNHSSSDIIDRIPRHGDDFGSD